MLSQNRIANELDAKLSILGNGVRFPKNLNVEFPLTVFFFLKHFFPHPMAYRPSTGISI